MYFAVILYIVVNRFIFTYQSMLPFSQILDKPFLVLTLVNDHFWYLANLSELINFNSLKWSENLWFPDGFRGDRSWLIRLILEAKIGDDPLFFKDLVNSVNLTEGITPNRHVQNLSKHLRWSFLQK